MRAEVTSSMAWNMGKRLMTLLALTLIIVALTSCMNEVRGVAAVPASISGTWVQVASLSEDKSRISDTRHVGFISIGPEHVVIAVTGLPRLISSPVSVTMDSTTKSGCIILDNGVRLYLTSGDVMVERRYEMDSVTQPMTYLDVETSGVTRTSTTPPETLRLFSERSLVCPVVHSSREGAALVTPAPVAVAPSKPSTEDLSLTASEQLRSQIAALGLPELRNAVQELLEAQAQSAPPEALSVIMQRATSHLRNDILARLVAARASLNEEQITIATTNIARLQAALAAFDILVSNYLART